MISSSPSVDVCVNSSSPGGCLCELFIVPDGCLCELFVTPGRGGEGGREELWEGGREGGRELLFAILSNVLLAQSGAPINPQAYFPAIPAKCQDL